MSYLLDTDIVSRFKRDTLPAKLDTWLRSGVEIFISAVTLAEMKYGAATAPEDVRDELVRRVDSIEAEFAEATEWLDLDVLIRWKTLLAGLKGINRTMTCEDSLIAAIALTKGHTLATNNVRHFEPARQFGLKVVNPMA